MIRASFHSLTPHVAKLCGEDTAALYGECAALCEEAAFSTHEMIEEQREKLKNLKNLKNLCDALLTSLKKRQILPASGAAILRREILKLNRKSRLAEDIASPSGRLSYHLSATVNIPRGQFGADLCIQLVTNLKLTCDEFATISASRSPNVWQNAG